MLLVGSVSVTCGLPSAVTLADSHQRLLLCGHLAVTLVVVLRKCPLADLISGLFTVSFAVLLVLCAYSLSQRFSRDS
jgi:hypothetical protein